MAKVMLRSACLHEADMSGAQLDEAVLTPAVLQKANLRGAGLKTVAGQAALSVSRRRRGRRRLPMIYAMHGRS
jgi:uncharacterized protein YjbI with pentapeptide repeats